MTVKHKLYIIILFCIHCDICKVCIRRTLLFFIMIYRFQPCSPVLVKHVVSNVSHRFYRLFYLVCRFAVCRTFKQWQVNLKLIVQCMFVKNTTHQENNGWEAKLTNRELTCLLKVPFVCALLPAWINCPVCFNSWERKRVICKGSSVSFGAQM